MIFFAILRLSSFSSPDLVFFFSIKWFLPHRYGFVFFFLFFSLTCYDVFYRRLVLAGSCDVDG